MEAKRSGDFSEISEFYIQAATSITERWPHTLKSGEMFALFDGLGDVIDPGMEPGGIFLGDTRHLSEFQLLIDGQRPLLLSSAIDDDNIVLTIDLSNPDIYREGRIVLSRETIHIRRSRFLLDGVCYERVAVRNFDVRAHRCWISFGLDADFADLFEIRGLKRKARGTLAAEQTGEETFLFAYDGLDGVRRTTEVRFDTPPRSFRDNIAIYSFDLPPGAHSSLTLSVACNCVREAAEPYSIPYRAVRRAARRKAYFPVAITSSNELANRMFHRAFADLRMLTAETPEGPYPYAGTPWFSTAFGRDGLITALQMLWLDPGLARGVLRFLAANQATEEDATRDAEPGKILHETRKGEMARLGEVPFGKYYGSVDSTPLFVLLAGRYFERTGDLETIHALWPAIEAALEWIERYGDADGDGFVEYHRESENGLVNQGWKDSQDSIFHAGGALARGPIALAEVQGYVYGAKCGAARIARRLGQAALAERLARDAEALRLRFDEKFWCEELGLYALALDGRKRRCGVRASNAGQVLFTGLARPDRAARVARTLLAPECFSGWGIRTVATGAARYNPMSYHNGSVWPHDNALIALGLARYGFKREAGLLFTGLFDAACDLDLMRLPELFCGFPRRVNSAPTLYPVACTPQAWASVAPLAMLEACLGFSCDVERRELRFDRPHLPGFLDEIVIDGLSLAGTEMELILRRRGEDVSIATGRRGNVAIRVTK